MFVRFKKRSLNIWRDETLEVILVSNHRIGRKVEQRCIKYLGSIRLTRIDSDFLRTEFWWKVQKSLATLDLHPNLQRAIENKISERVPIPEGMDNLRKNRIAPAGFRERVLLISHRVKKGR